MSRNIEWKELLEAQKKLDAYTFELKGLTYQGTFEKRMLALLVELHELANEAKVFKFWVSNPKVDSNKMLYEYVDVLHFTLSLFISRGEEIIGVTFKDDLKKESSDFVSKFFLDLVVDFSLIVKKYSSSEKCGDDLTCKDHLNEWAQKFLNLGAYLGFSWDQIVEAYWGKWNINMNRQSSGEY